MSGYEFGVGDDMNVANQGRFHQPGYVALHLVFRTAGFLTYLICSLIISSFVTSFVIVVVFLSFDFWIVKNVTGRKLVGLRWWNYVNDDGESKWIYESRKPEELKLLSSKEKNIFWIALVAFQGIWIALAFVALFTISLKWFILVCIANFLNGANLFGYIKCRYGKNDAQNAAMKFMAPQLLRNAWSGVTSKFSRKDNTTDDYRNLQEER
ncbi:putative Golgi apparatus membrane protein TVP23-like protein B [Hypsibius exemplaris]|uniref:Golgi apparatus membrane protein TVP23 homolog n=1 Tax=Hypsibius exemplaris TaxID=2072580 RepID=A0A9X6NBK8_HYPEX|nr:putative Golgi apparatus membrane protein TVP23-like protein B [Hypsibius exemplaris]